jgi:rsbT co-antagonist protein RsbR
MAIQEAKQPLTGLMASMGITPEEIERRKRYLEFELGDEERLKAVNDLARNYAEPVIEAFYRHLTSFGDTKAFFSNPATLERVKRLQVQYFLRLTQGAYDAAYVEERLKIGAVHERIGLDVKYYLGSYNLYLREVATRLLGAYPKDVDKAIEAYLSLMKLVFLDIGLAIDTYIFQRERTISLQQEAIRKLSTPVLQVRDGLLILPIIGEIDPARARQLTQQLLHSIRSSRARVVVIDITGVPAVDSNVANNLLQTVEASRLMGATAIVTGLTAEVAQTLVSLGVALDKLTTVGDLQCGIERAEALLGYKVTKKEEGGSVPEEPRR